MTTFKVKHNIKCTDSYHKVLPEKQSLPYNHNIHIKSIYRCTHMLSNVRCKLMLAKSGVGKNQPF